MHKTAKIVSLAILTLFTCFISACEEEISSTVVITEEVLFVSSEEVILSGRIFDLEDEADDHGFQVDETPGFSSSMEISLGSNNKLGKFIAQVDGLSHHTQYYYRAFIRVGGQIYFGEGKPVKTGTPGFKSISPMIGYQGNIVTVTGSNIPEGVKVFVGNKKADIYDLSLGSTLRFKIPPPEEGSTYLQEVKFVTGTDTVTFDQPFEYITGEWKKLSNFIEPRRIANGVSFIMGNQFYFGLGNQNNLISRRIWKLNVDTWSWTELNFPYSGYYSGFSSNQGFFGAGTTDWESESVSQRMWQAIDGNFVELTELPFALYTPISVTANGATYVGGGQISHSENNFSLYKYNSSVDTWELETTIPFVTNSSYGVFSFQHLIYFVVKDGSLWTYDTVTKEWAKIDKTPIAVKVNSICTVIGSKAYFGVGYDNLTIVEYDIEGKSWKEKYRFNGDKAFTNVAFFSYNNKIYTFRISPSSQEAYTEIWEFDPIAF